MSNFVIWLLSGIVFFPALVAMVIWIIVPVVLLGYLFLPSRQRVTEHHPLT